MICADKKGLIVPILLFAFALVFSLSALWLGDDIKYGYSFADGQEITSYSQVIPSQIAHWKTCNGRTVAHTLCQLFIPFWGQTAFSLANALVYVLLWALMCNILGVGKDDHWYQALIAALIVIGMRTKFTPTCQIGFPWMFALVLCFLITMRDFDKSSPRLLSSWHLLWALPLAFIAGWSQEALVIGVCVALGLYFLMNLRKMSLAQWSLIVAFACGAALLCLAPSTLNRTSETHGGAGLLPPLVLSLAKFAYYLRVTYILIVYMLYLKLFRKVSFKSMISDNAYLWIVWLIMMVFNLAIGVYGNRQLFGMELAAMGIIVRLAQSQSLISAPCKTIAPKLIFAALVLAVIVGDVSFIRRDRAVYNKIVSEWNKSEDGVVFYDFSSKDVTFRDTYTSDVFTWYALNTLAGELGPEKQLNVVPTICKEMVLGAHNANCSAKIADGTTAVVIDKSDMPSSVRICRNFIGKELSPTGVSLDEPVYENEQNAVYLVYEKLPLMKYGEVIFE